MKLIDDKGNEWELKCPDPQPPRWLWRDVWLGVTIALMIATQIFA